MRKILLLLLLALPLGGLAQTPDQKGATNLRGILLELLKTTHTKEDWFVPGNVAIAGLTPEQARWTDGKGGHSVGQLTYLSPGVLGYGAAGQVQGREAAGF